MEACVAVKPVSEEQHQDLSILCAPHGGISVATRTGIFSLFTSYKLNEYTRVMVAGQEL